MHVYNLSRQSLELNIWIQQNNALFISTEVNTH